jgi:hypothetical protein
LHYVTVVAHPRHAKHSPFLHDLDPDYVRGGMSGISSNLSADVLRSAAHPKRSEENIQITVKEGNDELLPRGAFISQHGKGSRCNLLPVGAEFTSATFRKFG